MGSEPVPPGYTPTVLPITLRGQAHLSSVETNTLTRQLHRETIMHETLQLLSAGPRRQASARTSAESDEACQRKMCVCACVRACVCVCVCVELWMSVHALCSSAHGVLMLCSLSIFVCFFLSLLSGDCSYSSGGEDGYVRIHQFDESYFEFEFEYWVLSYVPLSLSLSLSLCLSLSLSLSLSCSFSSALGPSSHFFKLKYFHWPTEWKKSSSSLKRLFFSTCFSRTNTRTDRETEKGLGWNLWLSAILYEYSNACS